MASLPLTTHPHRAELTDRSDAELVELARSRDEAAIRTLVRRHNQRLFRVARAILRSDAEAEDVVQASYVNAFTHLAGFRAESQLATWLTRITINEANSRLRRRRKTTAVEQIDIERSRSAQIIQFPSIQPQVDPETEMSRQEIRLFLEQAVDTLPAPFRAVFILRDVEGLNVEETAAALDIKPETVRTRLHRARKLMRSMIAAKVNGAFASTFPFDGEKCAGMADRVLTALDRHDASTSSRP
jgi:RNA polymerase sigma-70 factor (ECF subfamily)